LEVLFPVLEEIRAEFALKYPELLQNIIMENGKIMVNKGGSALNPLDVDIGPMVHWLTTQHGNRLSVRQTQLLRAVGEVRKSLAHCKPITGSTWKSVREHLIEVIDGGVDIRGTEFMRLAAHVSTAKASYLSEAGERLTSATRRVIPAAKGRRKLLMQREEERNTSGPVEL
jgi:hypothetical protein